MYFEEKVVYFFQLVLYFEQVLHLMSKSYISEEGLIFSSTSFIFRTSLIFDEQVLYLEKQVLYFQQVLYSMNKSYVFKKEVLYFHETSHIFRRTSYIFLTSLIS